MNRGLKFLSLLLVLCVAFLSVSCDGGSVEKLWDDGGKPVVSQTAGYYTVRYNANDALSGTVPEDLKSPYMEDSTVTVLGNSGGLSKTGTNFAGWNTKPDGSGGNYNDGCTFKINGDTVLYALFSNKRPSPDAPSGLSGVAPTVAGCNNGTITGLDSRKQYEYSSDGENSWIKVAADSSEISNLAPGDYYVRLSETEDTLAGISTFIKIKARYAIQLNANDGSYSVIDESAVADDTYEIPDNGFSPLAVSLPENAIGSCERYFLGWNTKADGTGVNYPVGTSLTINSNVSLFAQWGCGFRVSENKWVLFSKGNLVATVDASGSPISWRFAGSQYDYLGEGGANRTVGSAAGDIDLISWSDGVSDAYWGNAYNNANGASGWTSLSMKEWIYLLNERSTRTSGMAAKARYAEVKVCGIKGMLIFPDFFTWDESTMGSAPIYINTNDVDWNSRNYTVAQFAALEAGGCVFLPAAGMRDGESNVEYADAHGTYWSSSPKLSAFANYLHFYGSLVAPSDVDERNAGKAVRLVIEVTP